MYTLFSWYAWGFGKWVCILESDNKTTVKDYIKQHKTGTFCIVQNKTIVECFNRFRSRPGMCSPSFPIHYNGEIYTREAREQ